MWVAEEEQQLKQMRNDVDQSRNNDFELEEEEEDEEEVKPKKAKPRRPPIEVGARPGIIGFLASLTILAWTYFGTIPFTKKAGDRLDGLEEELDYERAPYEIYEAVYELRIALEKVLELNELVLMIAGLSVLFSILSFTTFTRWWLIPLSLTALLGLLGYAAWFENGAKTEFTRACNEWTDCQPAPPLWASNAMIASYCGGVAWLIIGLRVFSALMGREPVELEDYDDDFDFYDFYD